MGPHADDLYGFFIVEDLVNQPMLNINSSGTGAGQIADEFFMRRWYLVGILAKDLY